MKPLRHHGGSQRRAEVAEVRQPRVSEGNSLASLVTSKAGTRALPGTPRHPRKAYESEALVCSPARRDVSLQPPTGQSCGSSGPGA